LLPVRGKVPGAGSVVGVVVGGTVVVVVVVVVAGAAGAIVTVSTAEVDGANAALPEYVAVSWCVPAPSAEVVRLAGEWSAAVPSDMLPSKNSTVPVG
jgi:hypothetical protein